GPYPTLFRSAADTAGRLPEDPHNTEFDSTTGLAIVAPSDVNAQDSGQPPAVGHDRPAPGNVAPVGSVRSSQSLQTTLASSYDLSSVTPAAPAMDMDNAISDPAQPAASLVSEQATVQLQHGNPHASAQASGSTTVAGPGTMPAPSLQDLGLDGL